MTTPATLLHSGLERAAARFGDRAAVLAGDESWSFAELDARSTSFAQHLADHGVRGGDRVALMMSNRVEFVVAVNGISKLGAGAVLLSPAWKALEVDHALELTAPVHAVADGDAASLLIDRVGRARLTDLDDPATADALLAGKGAPPARAASGPAVSRTEWKI